MRGAAQPAEQRLAARDNFTGASAREDLRLSFKAAAEAAREQPAHSFRLAGAHVTFRFAGQHLAERLTRAFAHLEVPSEATPDLTLFVWESAAGGAPRPLLAPPDPGQPKPLPDTTSGRFPLGHTHVHPSYHFADGPLEALFQPTFDFLSALSLEDGCAWFWMDDSARQPSWDLAGPFRHLLSWWLSARGLQKVHAGAVGTDAGGVLVVGKGGSGKSTTCLSVLGHDGLRYAGDDFVAVSIGPEPVVHSLYCSGKVDPDNVSRLPHLEPAISNADRLDSEKAIVFVNDLFPGAVVAGFPLQAILIPRIVDRVHSAIVPTPSAAAVTALAPSTMLQLHPPPPQALGRIRRLAAVVPAFVLELGSDVAGVPDTLRQFLDELRSR